MNEKWKNRVQKLLPFILVLLGNCVYVFTVKLFLIPAQLISGGTTGLALAANHLLGIPLTAVIFAVNVTMLLLGWWLLGRQFALTTIFSSLFYPVALAALDSLLGDLIITQEPLLNTLFTGLGMGVGIGIVIRGGASTGGMDIPPLLLKKFFHIPVPVGIWIFDLTIFLAQMTFHPLEDLLYGVILLMTLSFSMNKVLMLGTDRTEVKIVSPYAEEIRETILSKLDRGLTILHGEGGYFRTPTEVILSVVSNHELPKIERMARSIDPDCFIIVSRVTEVWGRGFSRGKKAPSLRQKTEKID